MTWEEKERRRMEQIKAEVEEGEITPRTKRLMDLETHLWYRCECEPTEEHGYFYYFYNKGTEESTWYEPQERYWIWNSATQSVDDRPLQDPGNVEIALLMRAACWPDPANPKKVIIRYNRELHGDFKPNDPNTPYAGYFARKRQLEDEEEKPRAAGVRMEDHYAALRVRGRQAVAAAAAAEEAMAAEDEPEEHYATMATFNRATGAFQSAEQTAERHNDYNKSRRQLNAFYDVDAATNAHDGKSLKEERRNQTHSKKEIREFKIKKEERKRKKRMAFLMS